MAPASKWGPPQYPLPQLHLSPDGALYGAAEKQLLRYPTPDAYPNVIHQFVESPEDGAIPRERLVFGKKGAIYGCTTKGGKHQAGISSV
jgi:hypothetical protein